MLPVQSWYAAMDLEPARLARPVNRSRGRLIARKLRLVVGRELIAIGKAVAGPDAIAARPLSVGR